jgi:hypothetical protein
MAGPSTDLKARTKAFAVRIVRLVDALRGIAPR